MERGRRVIRVFPDWGHPWPLWEDGTDKYTDKYTMEPEDYGLSKDLTETMSRWYAFWEQHFDPDEGWDNPQNRKFSRVQGDRLVLMLKDEVSSFADVKDSRPR